MMLGESVHRRRSIRLNGYDYSEAGAYFVTVCTHARACLFGDVVEGEMRMNEFGGIVQDEWCRTPDNRGEIELGEFVVMPNHCHGIVMFSEHVGAIHESPLRMTVKQRRNMAIPKMIGRFKMLTAKRINESRRTPGVPVWQRNYYEHIIRDETELRHIGEYIAGNPAQWESDRENPVVRAFGPR